MSLLANLAFGLLYEFRLDPAHLEADESEYYQFSQQILLGDFALTARRTLGFPLALAAIRRVLDNFLLLQIVVCALYSLSAPILFLIARKVTRSSATAALCGLAFALWPSGIFFGSSLYSETLALPVFLASLYFLPLGSRVPGFPAASQRQAVACGIFLGLATHVRPMYLLFLPFLLVIVFLEERNLRHAAGRFLVILAGFLLMIAPWSAYMTARFHHPILVTSNGGETLSGGLNPQLMRENQSFATFGRTTWVGPGKWLTIPTNGYLSPAELALPYDQQDKILRTRTIQWAMQNPLDAAYLEMRKLAYMWGFYPLIDNGFAQFFFGNIPVVLLLLVAIAGFLCFPESRTRLARFWVLPLFVSAVALISWGSWRFRQPGDVGLLSFCVICALQYAWVARSGTASTFQATSASAR